MFEFIIIVYTENGYGIGRDLTGFNRTFTIPNRNSLISTNKKLKHYNI